MIASGGFADARGLVAALVLGADGISDGGQFEDVRELVAGARGRTVYELVERIVVEVEELIGSRLLGLLHVGESVT